MTSLSPARDAVLASREKMRAALAAEIAAGGSRAMHAQLTLGLNDLIALHLADCRDQNVDAQQCFRILENGMANAVGTIVMSGAATPEDRLPVWHTFMMAVTAKSRHALKLVEAGTPGVATMTTVDEPTVGHS